MKISENELIESCRLAVITAIKKGVDSAEAYSVSSVESEVSIERNDVKLGKFHQGSGIGIRVIKNGALGFSSVNMLCREEINEAVDASIKIASKGSYDQYNILPKTTIPQKLSGIYDREAQYFKSEDSVKNAVEMLKTAKRYDKRVTVDSGAFNNSLNSIAVVNSNGVECVEMVSSFTWYIMGMAVDGEEVSSFDFQFGGSHHLKDIEVESTARNFAENVVNSLGSKKCQPFKGTLILSPHAVAELILPTLVNSVNSNNVQKGRSSLIGKLEKEIACKELTITDDATWSDGLSASSFDREGVPHKKLDIINKGILKSYLYNTYTACRDKVNSTGHASGDEESSPGVGATNIIFKEGNSNFDDILSEVKKGILVTRFSGNVNPVSGDFSGVVKGGHLIISGERIHPLSETLIAGNIFESLFEISDISKDREKVFNILAPYIRVEDISVTSG